ncbi:MAG: hypothetical protein NTW20_10135, partial [Rhodobacterales bacterium]|nr:hypothetical protein [Rhodobacterales bacterium]
FRYETDATGIGLLGSDTLSFAIHPVALTIFVRDIAILSVSTSGFLQRKMGLCKDFQFIDGNMGKLLVSNAINYRNFTSNWSASFFRYSSPRYFDLQGVTMNSKDTGLERYSSGLLTDRGGKLEEVGQDLVCEVPYYQKSHGNIKLISLIEILEIQRDLMQIYDKIELDKKHKTQIRRTFSELNHSIDEAADLYDHLNPIPTYRRPFTRGLF